MTADAVAFFSLTNPKDQNHVTARGPYRDLLAKDGLLVTTNLILDEAYALLKRRLSPEVAVRIC